MDMWKRCSLKQMMGAAIQIAPNRNFFMDILNNAKEYGVVFGRKLDNEQRILFNQDEAYKQLEGAMVDGILFGHCPIIFQNITASIEISRSPNVYFFYLTDFDVSALQHNFLGEESTINLLNLSECCSVFFHLVNGYQLLDFNVESKDQLIREDLIQTNAYPEDSNCVIARLWELSSVDKFILLLLENLKKKNQQFYIDDQLRQVANFDGIKKLIDVQQKKFDFSLYLEHENYKMHFIYEGSSIIRLYPIAPYKTKAIDHNSIDIEFYVMILVNMLHGSAVAEICFYPPIV